MRRGLAAQPRITPLIRLGLAIAMLLIGSAAPAYAASSPTPAVSPAVDASTTSVTDWVQAAAAVVTAIGLVGGGAWGLYIYSITRRGRAALGIEQSVRLATADHGKDILLVQLKITNQSAVLFRHEDTTAILMDASEVDTAGNVVLLPFAREDPFLFVYGWISDDPDQVRAGRLFYYDPEEKITLEPGEEVESELAFPITGYGLMAMHVRVKGYEGKRGSTPYVWSSFFYIDPAVLRADRSSDRRDSWARLLRWWSGGEG